MYSLTNAQIEVLTEIYPAGRGWIIHYWEEVCLEIPQATLEEKQEVFFWLLEKLHAEGKVKFGDPEDWSWSASTRDIIAHLRKGWPIDIKHEHDELITSFFYDDLNRCPPISWLGTDGKWHGS